jgi:integrase
MASFRKREVNGKVRWDATVTKLGATRQTRTFQTKHAAERWARDIERDAERGAWRSTEVAERKTLGDLLKQYQDEVLVHKRSHAYASAVRQLLARPIARIPMIALRPDQCAADRDQRMAQAARPHAKDPAMRARKLSTQTVRHEVSLAKRAVNHAMREWGLFLPRGNPFAVIALPPPAKGRERRTEGTEWKRIVTAAYASRSPRLGPVIEIAVETAMRRGEICNLDWNDVDLRSRVARARETKNGEPRDVPLSPRAVTVLRNLQGTRKSGSVFGFRPDGLSQAFSRICQREGIENLRLHDLRHEGASRLAEKLNGDVIALSAITGHRTLQMIKRYTHLRAADLAKRLAEPPDSPQAKLHSPKRRPR